MNKNKILLFLLFMFIAVSLGIFLSVFESQSLFELQSSENFKTQQLENKEANLRTRFFIMQNNTLFGASSGQ